MLGYVYKTTNLKNNRVYIGQRKGRFTPEYYGSGLIIKRAIKKEGVGSFKVEVIVYAKDKKELDYLECKFIKEYKKLYGRNIYNLSDGGTGGVTHGFRQTCMCIKCRNVRGELTGKNNFIVKIGGHTEEYKNRLSVRQQGKTLKEMGHKDTCSCSWCKNKRHEIFGTAHFRYGKKNKHPDTCSCPFCKAKRREFVGVNNPMYGKHSWNSGRSKNA
jgi:hypothetical protein